MVVSPHGHKFRKSCKKNVQTHIAQRSQRVTTSHKLSQTRTKPSTPARLGGHRGSQNRTRPQRQRVWVVTEDQKIAPGPNASVSGRSQMVTKSHQAPTPAHPGGHKWSQNRTKPPKANVSGWSQIVTKSHRASTPACLGGHKRSQSRTKPQRQRMLLVTEGHKIAPSFRLYNPPANNQSWAHVHVQANTNTRTHTHTHAHTRTHTHTHTLTHPHTQTTLCTANTQTLHHTCSHARRFSKSVEQHIPWHASSSAELPGCSPGL